MKRTRWIAAALVGLLLLWAVAPYLMPTAVALGPCGRDWTSPTAYGARVSPTESLAFEVGGVRAKVCYGSPSARGRTIFGELVPFDELWRTGANEPTRLFTDGPLSVAGITVPAGRFSIYTRPGAEEWEVFLSRSTFHWGNQIGEGVRSGEMGETRVPVAATREPVETLRFRWESTADPAEGRLVLEWEATRIELPVRALR